MKYIPLDDLEAGVTYNYWYSIDPREDPELGRTTKLLSVDRAEGTILLGNRLKYRTSLYGITWFLRYCQD